MSGHDVPSSPLSWKISSRQLTRALGQPASTHNLRAWRIALEAAVVAVVVWLLHVPYITQRTFIDEYDNMIGGNVVAQGGTIYVDFISQHTPIAYWISALGHLVGADYFGGQRIFGFLVFAVLLAAVYARNVRTFGRLPLLVVVLLVPLMHAYNPDLSYAVLSDNYQAIAYVMLLLDVVAIGALRQRSMLRWLTMGLAGTLAIGVAFVAVYFVAAAVVTAVVLTIVDVRSGMAGWREWTRFVGVRAALFLAPFFVLVGVLLATGSLVSAYQQAYVLNREHYAQYLQQFTHGGLGSDSIAPLYTGLVDLVVHSANLPGQFAAMPVAALRDLLGIAVLVTTVVVLCRVRVILGIGLLWMASMTLSRGWNGYHAQPLWEFLIACLGILVWCLIVYCRAYGRRPWTVVATALVTAIALLSVVPYTIQVVENRHNLLSPIVFPNPSRSAVIEALVPEGGSYAELNVNNTYDFVVTGRTPAGGFSGMVPWFGDMLDSEMADILERDNPVLIFSEQPNLVWGFDVLEHVPTIVAFIDSRYTEVDLSAIGVADRVYIRTDSLAEAWAALRAAFPDAGFVDTPDSAGS